jgi:hypothetical protein
MAERLSEQEIAVLIEEPKPLPKDYRTRILAKPKRGHKERELDLVGAAGSEFRLILRQSEFNPLDFSAIPAYRPRHSTTLFRLRRYNGKTEHTNVIEGNTFYDFHVHEATERYQDSGLREDSYATPTDRYGDYAQAVRCMLQECGFDLSVDVQQALFEPEG